MTATRRATLCILTFGDYLPYFRRCLDSVLATTPLDHCELRLGFNQAPDSFRYTCERLQMESREQKRPNNVERFAFTGPTGLPVRLWYSPVNLFKEPMARLLWHDLPLETDYAVWFDDDSYVEPGWWEALQVLLEQGTDYIGQEWWMEYQPGQIEMIQAQPWYRGLPFESRDGRFGVRFLTGGFLAVRCQRLREVNFPDTEFSWNGQTLRQYGGDTLLGEIARQLGWSRAIHHAGIHINVDLQGRHPAPRRGPRAPQFGTVAPPPLTAEAARGFQSASARGLALLKEGKPAEAVACFEEAAQLAPLSARVCCHWGVALAQLGKLDEAIARYRAALQRRPDSAAAHNNLGDALYRLGRPAEAAVHFRAAARFNPRSADVQTNLGVALADLGRLDEAVACYRQALALQSSALRAQTNLGVILQRQGKSAEAAVCFQQVQRQRQTTPEAHYEQGAAWYKQGKFAEAVAAFEQAVGLRPHFPEAHNHLGIALEKLGRLDESLACYRRALRQRPAYAEALNNLGNALRSRGRPARAIACYRQALRLKPASAEAHGNLGAVLLEEGRLDEASACLQEALRLQPDLVAAHTNQALAWLLAGDFARGWPEFEWRWKSSELAPRYTGLPRWQGEPFQTLLLHAEQGLGDTLQFVRYAALAKEHGGTVYLECPAPLIPLLRRVPGIDHWLAQGSPVPADAVQAPLLSLPAIFQTTLATVPAPVPYLFADPDLTERWRRDLAGSADFKVGIAWQGNPKFRGDAWRSIPLTAFAPLAAVPGVQLFSLQKGHGTEQLARIIGRFRVNDLSNQLDRDSGTFMDTAAVMANLDLVITSDTAMAHLAGGLGVPVWVVLSSTPDWRWLLHREDCPWYPTMRLFRQRRRDDWAEVFGRVGTELRQRVELAGGRGTLTAPLSAGELLDKLTILEIKKERIQDEAKRSHVRAELALLRQVRERLPHSAEVDRLTGELKSVNEALWQIEDDIRACERQGEFGPRFVALARSVYRENDRRAALKRQLNERLGSPLIEEKEYR